MNNKKNNIVKAFMLTLTLVAIASISTQNASAQDSVETADLVLMMGDPCPVPAVDANGNLMFTGVGEEVITVENNNLIMLKCFGQDVANESGETQVYEGFLCAIETSTGDIVLTRDTHAVVTTSGVSVLTCKFPL